MWERSRLIERQVRISGYGRGGFSSADPDIGGTMSLLRSRELLTARTSAALLADLAVADSTGATTPDSDQRGGLYALHDRSAPLDAGHAMTAGDAANRRKAS